jgi:hypothetical protein
MSYLDPNVLLRYHQSRRFAMHRIKRATKTLSIVLLVGLISVLTGFPLLTVHRANGTSRGFNLLGFIAAWNSSTTPNPTITVVAGDSLTIIPKPGDGATHQWFLDLDNNGAADCSPGPDVCSSFFSTSSPPPVVFTADLQPKTVTFTYFCSVHPGTMHGQFTIQVLAVGGARYAE